MSVALMSKINIFFKAQDKEQIVERLQNSGLVQVKEINNTEHDLKSLNTDKSGESVEYLLAGIKFSIDYLLPYEKKSGSFLDRALGGRLSVTKKKIEATVKETDYSLIIETVQNIETAVNGAQNELAALQEEKILLQPWQELPFIINHKRAPKDYDFVLLNHANNGYQDIKNSLLSKGVKFESNLVKQDGNNQFFYIIYSNLHKSLLNEVLQSSGVEVHEIEDMEVKVPARLDVIATESTGLEEQLSPLKKELVALSQHLAALRIGYDYYAWAHSRADIINQAKATQSTAVMSGWVEKNKLAELEQELSAISQDTALVEVPLEDEEEPPVVMRNKKMFAPFEAVTNIYGAPQHNEPDPTAWLTPFFIIFFGLALTDVGYGIILAVLALLGLKFIAHTEESKKLMKVLFIGGISTTILGALFGGWLGIVLSDLPGGLIKETMIGLRVLDPMTNPISVLILTMILGVIQVMVGLWVNLQWQWKQGNKSEALLGSGVWLVFLVTLILWSLSKFGILAASLLPILQMALLAAVVLIVLAGTRKTKNWFLKLPFGVLSLYDLVGYFSDVLSYSRLLALGLGTGIIAMVVNLVASLAVEMIPVLGWVLFVLILIGGHAFNLAINVLGAYIHSSRLQFVEFFPKFMEGGGKVFNPFRKEFKYIRLID